MFKTLLSTLVTVCGVLISGSAFAQYYPSNDQFNADLNTQMQAAQNNMIHSNMNNPEVQRMYQIYQSEGGQLDFPNYCVRYAQTGGFNQRATDNFINQSWASHRQDQANYVDYTTESRRLKNETYAHRDAVQQRQARQRGEGLSAQAQFVNTVDGSSYQLPMNLQRDHSFRDHNGTVFYLDIHGRYHMNNGNGWQAMNYQN